MELRTAILWIHALAGGAWVAAALCFVAAGMALAAGSDDQRNFAMRAAPAIAAFGAAAAVVVLAAGVVNFFLAGAARGFRFSSEFGLILSIKSALFVGMSIALGWTLRTAVSFRTAAEPCDRDTVAKAMAGMVRANGAIAVMGAIALLLGLWLMGSA